MSASAYEDRHERVLGIYPNSYGFGFALMQGALTVIDKGMIKIKPACNTEAMSKIKELIEKYEPQRIILEDFESNRLGKSARVKQLIRSIQSYLKAKDIPVSLYSREQIRLVFDIWNAKTRYEIAEVIAHNIPKLKMLFFDKPKYPKSEAYSSALFDAVSICICHYYLTT